MREAYVTITDIPTHVITWGKWIEESFADNETEVIILITGNPGLPGFYTNFLSMVYENVGRKIPVWTIAHAGHDLPLQSSIREHPKWSTHRHRLDLAGQVASKREFIKRHVPKDVKIHLIGHSIGSWMILELLKDPEIKNKIKHCYLIFPTIERMAEAPDAKKVMNIYIPFLFIIKFLLYILSKVPEFIKTMLGFVFFYFNSLPVHALGTGIKFMNPIAFENSIRLAEEEMITVSNLNIDLIQEHKSIMKLYYSTCDGWVPVNYFKEIKERIPDLDAELDNKHIPHNFMSSKAKYENELADLVSNWIKNK